MAGSLVDGDAQLTDAANFLERGWQSTEAMWHDAVRNRFEEERLDPLLRQLQLAQGAIQRVAEVLNSARRHVADADRSQD